MTREDSSPTTPTGATPTPSTQPDGFDIVNTYSHLLLTDPDLTMPVAAIESLITLLSTTPLTTISETLSLLSSASTTLKNSVPNPISLSAGTDLFQRYLITQLQAHRNAIGRAGGADPAGDFRAIRNHLLTNGRLFVQRAKASREKIARFGRGFIRDGTTVLTNGGSRVVGALLKAAATSSGSAHSTPGSGPGGPRFRVIYVAPDLPSLSDPSSNSTLTPGHTRLSLDPTISTLRALHVPVAVIPFSAIASTLPMISMVIVGAEGVVENGGIINRLGTYQLGLLAKSAGKPFYVVAESHKFVRMYPLGQGDLGLQQRVVEFMTGVEEEGKGLEVVRDEGGVKKVATANGETMAEKDVKPEARLEEAVDFTPPDLISALITEGGVLTPSAVSEELIKIWF
ncbi:MAG: translation initiation factor eIF-2B subunit alpha [Cirrosporium novae-zelandiae]|nr:MAG: translation initiation factor eIF-2B subunit alpha [Cirrosporium novae-zelandiae]KAI9735543.1 MAG: translation initiation factor eIF-2B subunit alpha [Cirrosporium novae-zelandiae]